MFSSVFMTTRLEFNRKCIATAIMYHLLTFMFTHSRLGSLDLDDDGVEMVIKIIQEHGYVSHIQ